jgi:hypothetical protein
VAEHGDFASGVSQRIINHSGEKHNAPERGVAEQIMDLQAGK